MTWRTVELSVEAPFNYELSLKATPPPPPFELAGLELRRCLCVSGEHVPIRLRVGGCVDEPSAYLQVPSRLSDRLVDEAARRAEWFMCAKLRLEEVYRSIPGGAGLERLVRELRGLKLWLAPDPWEGLVASITLQQVSLRAAYAMLSSLAQRLGPSVEVEGKVFRSLPPPPRVLEAGLDALRECKLSRAKSAYIVGAARLIASGQLDLGELFSYPTSRLVERLREIRGVGGWTAEVMAIASYGRWEVVPAADLGLRKAVAKLIGSPEPLPPSLVREVCRPWGSWRGLLAYYVLIAYERGLLSQRG
ncbi:MAG: hypothetical protein N3H31_05250 [Candidatus Nezhaarchaeota archaeon]|nr:hypothetical protein [Candidatus Nezhaarchaeota archaeon]